MEEIKTVLKNLIDAAPSKNKIFKRNILKEYLQILVLDYIYSHKDYSRLIFYGGSCLAHCHNLPRLSEDLDFVDAKNEISIARLADDLEKYFNKKTDIKVRATTQKFRVYLKFPVLYELGLSEAGESDFLILKVEVFQDFNFCQDFKTEIIPLFKLNRSILVRAFDLPTLMATKIHAVLFRKWEKSDKTGKVIAKVKGRDYFDLMWYLQKEIRPNISCIEGTANLDELKEKLSEAVKKADARSIQTDLEALIDDKNKVLRLSDNMNDILIREIGKMK